MARNITPVQKPLAKVAGKTAFVTGGSSGIGLGIARVLSDAGMKVVFTYRSEKHRDSALASFPKDNPGVHAIQLDMSDREGMVRAADEAERVFGNVHLLVNNAGVGIPALLSNVSWQDWDWAMDVNINGVFSGVRTFLPRMLAHGEGGHIMATSSSAGIVAGSLGVYATTKFAVVGMMESLRTEMFDAERNRPASHGVTAKKPAGPPPLLPGSKPVDLMGVAMDPMEAGRQVLAGIRRNDLYILSHPEFAGVARERFRLMMESFSKQPAPEARQQVTAFIIPDIYAADLAKRGKKKPAAKKKVTKKKPAKRSARGRRARR